MNALTNAEPHELLYLLIGGIGALLTFLILLMRVSDVWSLYQKQVNGSRRALAWERLLSCGSWFFVNGFMVTVGIVSLFTPPQAWNNWRYVTIGTFYAVALLATCLALLQWYIRRKP